LPYLFRRVNVKYVAVGIPLGVLIGIASSAAFIIFLRAAFLSDGLKAAGSLLAMPTAWFGGGWLTSVFDLDQILSAYVTSLAVSVVLICSYPLARVVIRIGSELGATG
jgi:hypothetical protein